MHRCLLIAELVLHIVDLLAGNSGDVARLARTCKVLSKPALDALWRTQHSLSPLVMCLPPDLWMLTKQGEFISFKRVPTPADWHHVQKYTLRIRSISQPASYSLPRLNNAALAALMTPSNFGALFKSLRTLDYSVISDAAPIHLLSNLITERCLESITDLSLVLPKTSQENEISDLFQAIRTNVAKLEAFRIESYAFASSNPHLAVNLVQGKSFLLKLDLSSSIHVSAECMASLAEIACLQEISLFMRRDIDPEFLGNGCLPVGTKCCGNDVALVSPIKRTFPALRSLRIKAYTLDQCTALLSLIASPLLDTIVFLYKALAPSALIETFFCQVQKTSQIAMKTTQLPVNGNIQPRAVSLTLEHDFDSYTSVAYPILHPSHILSPLLTLQHLRILRLLRLGMIDIDNAFLLEAGRAWGRHLHELDVCGIPLVSAEEKGRMPGLVSMVPDGVNAFVSMCPSLEKLRVALGGHCLTWGEHPG